MPQKVSVTKSKIDTLAQAIAEKANEAIPLTITDMTDIVVDSLIKPYGTKSINYNGEHDVSNYEKVQVDVSGGGGTISLQSKTVNPTTSQQIIAPDAGYDGLVSVTVTAMPTGTAGTPTAEKGTVINNSVSITPSVTNTAGYIAGGTLTGTAVSVSASELVSGSETKTANGTYNVTNLAELVVNVPSGTPSLQTKTVNPTESTQTVTADSGYDGLSSVQVNAISPTYIGSGVQELDLPQAASTMHGMGSNIATVNRSTSTQYINIGPGYNDTAGYYTITATPNGTVVPPASITGTNATVSTGSNTLTLTKAVAVNPYVSTPGYISAGTEGNSTVTLTANVTTKAAATITPTTSAQTISAGTYLTGAQTIAAIPSQYIVPSGNKEITANGNNIDVAQYSTVSVNVAGSSKNAQIAPGVGRVAATSYTAVTGQTLTVAKTGTYDIYWIGYRSSTSGTNGSQLYVGNTAHSSGAQTTFDSTYTNFQHVHLSNVSLTANQTVTVRARSRGTSYYMYVSNFTIIEV